MLIHNVVPLFDVFLDITRDAADADANSVGAAGAASVLRVVSAIVLNNSRPGT